MDGACKGAFPLISAAHEKEKEHKSAWQRAKDLAHKAHGKVVDVLNPATAKKNHVTQ